MIPGPLKRLLLRSGLLSRMVRTKGKGGTTLVALTFDDGPNSEFTPRVLDVLKEQEVKATFVVLGNRVEAELDLVRRIIEEGHEIGIHGFDHTAADLPGQVRRCADALEKLGVRASHFRPPRGRMGIRDLLRIYRTGYLTVLWSVDAHDSMRHEGKWPGPAPAYDGLCAGDIVLMHDDNPVCLEELPVVIEAARKNGLAFGTISELMGKVEQ